MGAREPNPDSAGGPAARKWSAMKSNLTTMIHRFEHVALAYVANLIQGLEELGELPTSDSGSTAALGLVHELALR